MATKPEELLAKCDGRYYAIDKFDAGLAMLAKAEKLGTIRVDFAVPSGPALFLNLARSSYMQINGFEPSQLFYAWQNGNVPINQSLLFDYFESYSAHVIFSFTALEAFANERIPEEFVYEIDKKGQKEVLTKPDIERRVSLDEKLDSVLPQALGIGSPKGTQLWEHYKLTKSMRDRLIHLKSVDRSASGEEHESVWGIMLRSHGRPFCDYAHAMIGHYLQTLSRRWYGEYPFQTKEPDKLFGD